MAEDCENNFVDYSKWYAAVKFMDRDGGQMVFQPVENVRVAVWSKSGDELLRTEKFVPKSPDDFQKDGYNYTVLSKDRKTDGKDHWYFAMIGRLAPTAEALRNSEKRITFNNVFNSDVPEDADPSAASADESDEELPLNRHRTANIQKRKLADKARQLQYNQLMRNYRLDQEFVEPEAPSKRPRIESDGGAPTPSQTKADMKAEILRLRQELTRNESLESRSSSLSSCNGVEWQAEILRFQQKLEKHEKTWLSQIDKYEKTWLSQIDKYEKTVESRLSQIDSAVQSLNQVFSERLENVVNLEKKMTALQSEVRKVSEQISKSPYVDRFEYVQSWVDSISS